MKRRRKRSWKISQATLLLAIVALIAAGYLIWRYPEQVGQVLDRLAAEATSVSIPPPPIPADPTAALLPATPAPAAPAPRATLPPAAPPPVAEPGDSTALHRYKGEWYQLYFTNPSYPDAPENHVGGIDVHLAALLDTARQSIDLAAYDFDLENVANALASAAGRGVRVRMVTDTDTLTSANPEVQRAIGIVQAAGIPIVDDQRPAIMHDKFVVVDGVVVWTGSWNLTVGDTYRLNNNAIRIVSPELARNYTLEFEQMFAQRRFGPSKQASLDDPVLTIGGARVENYFAPEDQVEQKIIGRIEQARVSIHFLAFSFTSDTIGKAMREREKAGVQIAGVFETTGSETLFSEYGKFHKLKLDVLQDGNPYAMHHKVIIIDSTTVIFGSYNFSNNADRDNDENLLIVDDPALAQAFEAEFQRVHAQARR